MGKGRVRGPENYRDRDTCAEKPVRPRSSRSFHIFVITKTSKRRSTPIAEVVSDHPGMVLMKTGIGGTRVVDVLFGEQLPRIC
jgi:hydrogenase maturation factor